MTPRAYNRGPHRMTPAVRDGILQAIRAGVPRCKAAEACNISPRTLRTWLARGKRGEEHYGEFRRDVAKAEADCVADMVAIVQEAARAGTWQAAAWWLERRHPDAWGTERRRLRDLEKLLRDLETRLRG